MPAHAPLQKRPAPQHDGAVAQAHSASPTTQLARALNARPRVAQLRALSTNLSRGAPAQRAPSQLKPLKSALMSSAARAPMQFAFWDYLKAGNIYSSVLLGGATAALAASGIGIPAALALGALTGASTYAGGVGAGIGTAALGGAGILAAGALPVAAATAAGAVTGGAVGAIAGRAASGTGRVGPRSGAALGATTGALLGAASPVAALGLLGSLYGGTAGLDAQAKVMPAPNLNTGIPNQPIGDAVFLRAERNAAALNPNPTGQQITNQIGAGPLRNAAQAALNGLPVGAPAGMDVVAVQNALRNHLQPGGAPIAPAAPPGVATINAVRNTLTANPFVLAATTVGVPAAPGANPLAFGNAAPQGAQNALGKFNRLVNRPAALPNITHAPTMSPVSSMSHGGQLNMSWAAPEGTIVHEMGHHLENNLDPLEFGTVHHYLARRSVANNQRPTGLGAHFNKTQVERGYNTNTPNPLAPSAMPFTALGTSLIGMSAGLEAGHQGVDHFVQSLSHTPEASYATQVYNDGTMATEFVSTTIHLMAEPGTAAALLQADPLRVALFLKLARPADYALVANQLANPPVPGPPAVNLNNEIHAL